MKFIICSFAKILLLMSLLISTSHAIALYSTLTETLYMDCVQHSSQQGAMYRVDLKLSSTGKSRQQWNKKGMRQVLIATRIVEMSHTSLCQPGVDPVFNEKDSVISVNIPQVDVIGNDGNFLGTLRGELAGSDKGFDIIRLDNLTRIQVVVEDRPKVVIANMQAQVMHGIDSSDLGVCLELAPTVSQLGDLELNVHIAMSAGDSDPANLISVPRVEINDLSKMAISDSTDIYSYGTYTALPILSDIPQLGYIFKHDWESSLMRGLVVTVTPQVIECEE